MNKTKLLCRMYENLSDSLKGEFLEKRLYENYKKQLEFYATLFKGEEKSRLDESFLVCARCFISLSRSLYENCNQKDRILEAKRELNFLSPIFVKGEKREGILKTVQQRINVLSQNDPDQIGDSVLFLYLALTEL